MIASRKFRRPGFDTNRAISTLEIRPFNEVKIADVFRAAGLRQDKIDHLLRQRRNLIPLARNPFTAGLMIDYLKEEAGGLPENQAEIYNSCIRRRLGKVRDLLTEYHLDADRIIEASILIAGVRSAVENSATVAAG